MNKCTERIYEWSCKRKSDLRSYARNVSDSCSYDFCHQRNRNGTFYNGCADYVQHADLHAAERLFRIQSVCRHLS